MEFLPAYDQDKMRPVLILEFIKTSRYDGSQPASYGQQFTTVLQAAISDEHGLIELVDVENLVILWHLIRISDDKIRTMSFSSIEKAYRALVAAQDSEQDWEERYE